MIEPQAPRTQVSLEDLLRLKRAEKPGHEFWVDFEESLRAKQLAAIVKQKPWWRTFPALTGWSLPLSAAAALATSLVVINHSHPRAVTIVREQNLSERVVAAKATPAVETATVPAAVAVIPTEQAVVTVAAPAITPEFREPKIAVVATSAPANRGSEEKTVSLSSVSEQIAGIANSRADSAAVGTFTSVGQAEPFSLSTIGGAFDKIASRFGEVARSEKPAVVEPLAQLTSPRETRRNRLLAFAGSVDTRSPQYADSSNVARSRERISTHLTEEAIYESLHRLGLQGGGVSIHF